MNKKGVSLTILVLVVATVILALVSWQASITKATNDRTQFGKASYLDNLYEQRTIMKGHLETIINKAIIDTNHQAMTGEPYEEILSGNIKNIIKRNPGFTEINLLKEEQIIIEVKDDEVMVTLNGIIIKKELVEPDGGMVVEYQYDESIILPLNKP